MKKHWGIVITSIGGLIVLADQLIKYFVNQKLQDSPGVFFIENSWLHAGLVPSHNPFIAFSLPVPLWLTISISILLLSIIGILIQQALKTGNHLLSLLYAIVFAGAAGNFIDRIIHGFVTDYLSIRFGSWHFAIFNLADIAITLGILTILVIELKKPTPIDQ